MAEVTLEAKKFAARRVDVDETGETWSRTRPRYSWWLWAAPLCCFVGDVFWNETGVGLLKMSLCVR